MEEEEEMKKRKGGVSRIVMIGCFSVLVVIGGAGPLVHVCLGLTALVSPLYLRWFMIMHVVCASNPKFTFCVRWQA
jgi:hypothetical protein